jgi:hypothetical protein
VQVLLLKAWADWKPAMDVAV